MLRNLFGFFLVWLLVFGVYYVWSATTLKEKLKLGRAVMVTTGVTIFAALCTVFIVIAF
jgi:hypothetical protein